jgi:hypothetical protein
MKYLNSAFRGKQANTGSTGRSFALGNTFGFQEIMSDGEGVSPVRQVN